MVLMMVYGGKDGSEFMLRQLIYINATPLIVGHQMSTPITLGRPASRCPRVLTQNQMV
jgi:hypothetical protein